MAEYPFKSLLTGGRNTRHSIIPFAEVQALQEEFACLFLMLIRCFLYDIFQRPRRGRPVESGSQTIHGDWAVRHYTQIQLQ